MKKYGIMSSVKTTAIILFVCAFIILVLAMLLLFGSETLPYLMRYGYDSLNEENRTVLWMAILMIATVPIAIMYAKSFSGRFICVTDEKVYGNIGMGLIGKEIEVSYNEIISCTCKNDAILIETVKGEYLFYKIESFAECCNLINQKKKQQSESTQ